MKDFILILGDDPLYKPRKTFMFVALNSIRRAYPIYAAKGSNDDYWRCTPEDQKAELRCCQLVDYEGKEYDCSVDECRQFGIAKPEEPPHIGYHPPHAK
jgi:hypothetical protein